MPVPQTPLKGNGALKGPFHNQLAAQLDAITAALGATPEGTAATVTARLTTSDAATTAKYSKPGTGIPATDMATAVQTSLGKADSAYQKPGTGIPATDAATAVQTSLGKADSAYQKPGGGIPSSDMATAVQTSLGKADSALQTKAANQAASGETLYPTVAQFNTLLASLKAAGLMVADS